MKALITGGNRGIGRAIAEQLLADGHEVVITSRDIGKGKTTVAELKRITGKQNIDVIEGSLSDIQGCYELVDRVKHAHSDINCLISNAGVWMTERQLNSDGIEMSFMVNHVAPFILFKELHPVLQSNQPARIVNVNAGLYVKGKLDIAKTPTGQDFHSIKTYANTKLCNVMSTIHFSKEITGSGVTINSVHPGVINTGLGDSPKFLSKVVKLIKRFWKEPAYGAIAPVWLATDAALEGVSGKYYNEKEEMDYIDSVKDQELCAHLIRYTEGLINQKRV